MRLQILKATGATVFLKPVHVTRCVSCPTIAVLQCPGNDGCRNIKIRRGTLWCSLFLSDNALYRRINTTGHSF
jgi:hypothetical protein